MKKYKIIRGIAGIVTAVALTATCVTYAMNSLFPARIHEFLGTSSRAEAEGDDSTQYYKSAYESSTAMINAKLNNIRQSVEEGAVLLKNEDDALPLKPNETKVTLLGKSSVDLHYNGGSGMAKITAECVTLDSGLKSVGITANPEMLSFYKSQPGRVLGANDTGVPPQVGETNPSKFTSDATKTLDNYKDAAIIVFSRELGEGNDAVVNGSKEGGNDFNGSMLELTEDEQALLTWTKEQRFGKIIVIFNTDNAIAVSTLKSDDKIDALLNVGGLGYNGAEALANIISGAVNPSGHLVDTLSISSTSAPAVTNFGDYTYSNVDEINAGLAVADKGFGSKYIVEAEGIYIGYKYYETRYNDLVEGKGNANSSKGSTDGQAWNYSKEVGYSFGYGESYTTFKQTITDFKIEGKTGYITVEVENIGETAGKDVVQLYVQTPYDPAEKIEKAAIQLVNFEKTELIQPHEKSDPITIEIDMSLVASYDYQTEKTFVMSAGDYYFALGNGAHDALNNVLTAREFTTANGMDYDGNSDLVRVWNNAEKDTQSYSVSATGKEITNLFDSADLNDWQSGAVTYLSRNDWDGTWVKSYSGLSATADMINRMNGDPTSNGVDYTASSVKEYAKNLSANNIGNKETSLKVIELRGKDYNDPMWENLLNQISLDDMGKFLGKTLNVTQQIGSVTYPGSNDGDGPAGFMGSLDYENGTISARIYSAQSTAAATWNKVLLHERGEFMGEDGLYLHKTALYAPGMNNHRTPFSGRNVEYFSEDGILTYYLAIEEVSGMNSKGIIPVVKHFAVNEQETNRGGISTFVNEQAMREIALRGFEGAVVKGRTNGLMSSFNRIGLDYAGQSVALMDMLLRGEWGYNGYSVTDEAGMTYMQHVNATLPAGTDAYLTTAPRLVTLITKELNSTTKSGDYTYYAACRQAIHRVLYAYVNSNAMNGYSETSGIATNLAWWQVATITVSAALGAAAVGLVALSVVFGIKDKKKEDNCNE